jgi:hypothetical protein
MNVNNHLTDIIGVRILRESGEGKGNYHMIHVFEGEGWKEGARLVMPMYQGKSNVAFHTLHRWKSGVEIPIEVEDPSLPFWLFNPYFHVAYLR